MGCGFRSPPSKIASTSERSNGTLSVQTIDSDLDMDIRPSSHAVMSLSSRWRSIFRKASREPVVITTRGRSSHVMMSLDEYNRLTRGPSAAAISTATIGHVSPDARSGIFNVLCRIDAYADYVAEVEAETAEEAAERAYDSHEDYRWEFRQTAEFDDRRYVTLDDQGDEIDATEMGDF